MKLLALALIATVELTSLPKPIQQEINDLYGTWFKADFKHVADALTPSERAAIIEYLNQDVERAGFGPTASEEVLVNLGEENAIRREALAFPNESSGGASNLFKSIQPKVIIALAPKMFSNEPPTMIGPVDAPSYRPSFEAAEVNRAILANSPYFSPAVHAWAASWRFGIKPIEFRREMCKWWLANRRFMDSGDYADVQPGDPSPTQHPSPGPMDFVTFTPNPAATPSAAISPRVVPLPFKQSNSLGLEIAIGVLAVITAGALIVLWRRR